MDSGLKLSSPPGLHPLDHAPVLTASRCRPIPSHSSAGSLLGPFILQTLH